jgi:hypothetical protein
MNSLFVTGLSAVQMILKEHFVSSLTALHCYPSGYMHISCHITTVCFCNNEREQLLPFLESKPCHELGQKQYLYLLFKEQEFVLPSWLGRRKK